MLIPADPERLGALSTGHVEPVQVWTEVNGRRQPGDQERDQVTGLPLWQVHALIPTDTRPMLIAVRVPSRECPDPVALEPVAFERLVVNVRVDRNGKLAAYWSAAGVASHARPAAAA